MIFDAVVGRVHVEEQQKKNGKMPPSSGKREAVQCSVMQD